MSARIKELYRKAKLKIKGKGIHTYAFHKMAVGIKRANPSYSMQRAYAIAMGSLGRNKSVKKSHWAERKGK